MSNAIRLDGCRPEPLAHYLKALGILRLISEQKPDSETIAYWDGDTFCLNTKLTRQDLSNFFLNEYQPTPIIAPWNGGSGFMEGDNQDGIAPLQKSKAKRFDKYKKMIVLGRALCKQLEDARDEWKEADKKAKITKGKNEKDYAAELKRKVDDVKKNLLMDVRNQMPDWALHWLDAAVMLSTDKAKYPPLLGTGGADGRLEFSNNFMQRIIDVFDVNSGVPNAKAINWLSVALFSETVPGLQRDMAIGQFFPGAAGGANCTSGFDGKALVNPWDFLLMIEGSLVFATATTRKLGSSQDGTLSYPFTLRATGVDYASADKGDEDPRGEIWMPLWEKPAGISEIIALFAEGRATVNKRQAVNGVDFARAIATLGIDRGITAFNRFGFQKRNGKSYFANPLGRWKVSPVSETNLISEIDGWLENFRRSASSDNAPASVGRALRAVESAIMELCRSGSKRNVQEVCTALGKAERTLALAIGFRKANPFTKPVPLLSASWISACDDKSPEFRLACALASAGIRENMEPVRVHKWVTWENENLPHVVWGEGRLVDNLLTVLERRLLDSTRDNKFQGLTSYSNYPASLSDISAFTRGEVDEKRLEDLLWGLNLIDWAQVESVETSVQGTKSVPLAYALLKLCFLPVPLEDIKIPKQPAIIARARAGDAAGSTRLASKRLIASGFIPRVKVIAEDQQMMHRCTAALLFPIRYRDINTLADMVLQPTKKSQEKGE